MFEILNEKCDPQNTEIFSPCYELRSSINVSIDVGETKAITLGVKISKDKLNGVFLRGKQRGYDFDYFCRAHILQIYALNKKHLSPKNGIEVVSLSDTEELSISLTNIDAMKPVDIVVGEPVAQCALVRTYFI